MGKTHAHALFPSGSQAPVVWFTGLSGAGKSTLARALALRLKAGYMPCALLDADDLRRTICADLGYTRADKRENLRRIACMARDVSSQGEVAIVACIAPYAEDRAWARMLLGNFIEVYVDASLRTCMERDPKGLYRRAIAGDLAQFAGVDHPYEPPVCAEVVCRTAEMSVNACAGMVMDALVAHKAKAVVR